jgi:hypothetical protein
LIVKTQRDHVELEDRFATINDKKMTVLHYVAQQGLLNETIPILQAGGSPVIAPVTVLRLELNNHPGNDEQIANEAMMMTCETTLKTIGFRPELAHHITRKMGWNLGSLSTLASEEITALCNYLRERETDEDSEGEDEDTSPRPWIDKIKYPFELLVMPTSGLEVDLVVENNLRILVYYL